MSERLSAAEVRTFVAVAGEYCASLEAADRVTCAQLVRQLDRLLPLLYHAGACLSQVEPDTEEIANVETWSDEARRIDGVLAALLGKWNTYQEIFDPAESEDVAPVTGSLSSDLAEIYLDVRRSLTLAGAQSVSERDVLWEWRFAFSSHWGRHAASALRVVNSLVHTQFADVLDESPSDA